MVTYVTWDVIIIISLLDILFIVHIDLLLNQTSVIQIKKYSEPEVDYSNRFDLIIFIA